MTKKRNEKEKNSSRKGTKTKKGRKDVDHGGSTGRKKTVSRELRLLDSDAVKQQMEVGLTRARRSKAEQKERDEKASSSRKGRSTTTTTESGQTEKRATQQKKGEVPAKDEEPNPPVKGRTNVESSHPKKPNLHPVLTIHSNEAAEPSSCEKANKPGQRGKRTQKIYNHLDQQTHPKPPLKKQKTHPARTKATSDAERRCADQKATKASTPRVLSGINSTHTADEHEKVTVKAKAGTNLHNIDSPPIGKSKSDTTGRTVEQQPKLHQPEASEAQSNSDASKKPSSSDMSQEETPPGDLPTTNQNASNGTDDTNTTQATLDPQQDEAATEVSSLSNHGDDETDNGEELCERARQSMTNAKKRQVLRQKAKRLQKPIPPTKQEEKGSEEDSSTSLTNEAPTKPPPSLRPSRYSLGPTANGSNEQMDDFLSTTMTRQVISHNRISQMLLPLQEVISDAKPLESDDLGKERTSHQVFVQFCEMLQDANSTLTQGHLEDLIVCIPGAWKQQVHVLERIAITHPRHLFPARVTPTGIDCSNAVTFWMAVATVFFRKHGLDKKTVQVAGTVQSQPATESRFLIVLAPRKGEKRSTQGRLKQLFLQAGNEVDPQLHLLPWSEQSRQPALRFDADLPTTTEELQVYLPDATLAKAYKTIFVKARLRLCTNPLEMTTGRNRRIAEWADEKKLQIFKNTMDHAENPRMIGWIAYTGNFTDVPALHDILTAALTDLGETFEFGLKVKTMREVPSGKKASDAHYRNGGNWMTFPWRAVHIEVDKPTAKHAVSVFSQIFNDDDNPRPAGMFLWFIPFPQYALISTDGTEDLLQTSRNTHIKVLQNLCPLQTEDIEDVDISVDGMTLREFLLSRKSKRTGKALFHAVDKSQSYTHHQGMHTVMVMKGHRNEAQVILNALPAICRKENENYREWFISDEVFDNDDYQFDEQSQAWTSKTDVQLRQMKKETVMHFALPSEMLDEDKAAHPSELEEANFGDDLQQAVQAQTQRTSDAVQADTDDPSVDEEASDPDQDNDHQDHVEDDDASTEWNGDGQRCDTRQTKHSLQSNHSETESQTSETNGKSCAGSTATSRRLN